MPVVDCSSLALLLEFCEFSAPCVLSPLSETLSLDLLRMMLHHLKHTVYSAQKANTGFFISVAQSSHDYKDLRLATRVYGSAYALTL